MTDNRLLAVKNATCEAIDHLHGSLESCPGPNAEVPDPRGIKVPTQKHAQQTGDTTDAYNKLDHHRYTGHQDTLRQTPQC